MKRRIAVELELVETIPGSPLEVIAQIAGALERLKADGLVVDYGIGLEYPVSWLVKIAAQAPEPEEPGHGAAEEVEVTQK